MSENISALSEMRVLYVEDSDDIRLFASQVLKRRVKELYLAEDGEIGEKTFFEYLPDIVVTDITMPNKDGLEMAKDIKDKNPDTPIIVATAHNEEDRFISAIEIGIDRYIVKPIEPKKLIKILEDMALIVKNKRLAEEYQKKQIEEKIRNATTEIMSKIIDSSPNPEIVYKGNEVFYVNSAFLNMLDEKQEELILKENKPIDTIFLKRDGFISSLSEFDESKYAHNKVTIKVENGGRKIYYVIKRDIVGVNDEVYTIFTFNDITLFEYQKLKATQYSEMLQELIFKHPIRKKAIEQKSPTIESKETQKEAISIKEEQKEVTKKEKIELEEEQKQILRKSHKYRVSAIEYTQDIGEDILEELDELKDLEEEIKLLNEEFISTKNLKIVGKIAEKFDRVAAIINLLFEFQDLSYAIRHLSTLLKEIGDETIDEKKLKSLQIYISAIAEEIGQWRRTIFETKEAIDIHYLDASLFGSCLQIELSLQDKKIDPIDEEDDLLLF